MASSAQLKTPSSLNATKRKSSLSSSTSSAAKKPRVTLDSFFSPQVRIRKEPVNEKDKENPPVSLNEEQKAVLNLVVNEEKNVFFTGPAGTGKSLLLRTIISALKKKYENKPGVVSVTASTGLAASNVGGMTIHAWGAVAPNSNNVDSLISYIRKCKPALHRWKNTKVLIVDEVSMVDGHLFDRLSAIATQLRRKTKRPFGGIQIIVTGDFFQLPPVSTGNAEPFFAFESDAWKSCIEETIFLNQVFRQKDNAFVDLLNSLRKGAISPAAHKIFAGLSRSLTPSPTGILATELFAIRREVDSANFARLSKLPGDMHKFVARDSSPGLAAMDDAAAADKRTNLLKNMPAPERLDLKVGAQVMLVKNIDAEECLVNGSVGRILGFYEINEIAGSISGAVVRKVKVDNEGKPVPLESAKEENKENISAKGKTKTKKGEALPLVEFIKPSGKEAILLARDEFRVEDSEGKLLARRVQVPLVLAWAMSIHKSQGQTIERVKIDLGRVFEKGQSYVALSRAASMEGLQVIRFDPKRVRAHPKVLQWSELMENNSANSSTPESTLVSEDPQNI